MVFGCGNPLAGDDGVGVQVLHRVCSSFVPGKCPALRVQFRELGTDALSMAAHLIENDRAIVVDAMQMGRPAGTVAVFSPGRVRTATRTPLTLHDLGPGHAAHLAIGIDADLAHRTVMVGVQPKASADSFPAPMTEEVSDAIPRAAAVVRRFLLQWDARECRERA